MSDGDSCEDKLRMQKHIKSDDVYLMGTEGSDIYIGMFYNMILSGYCFFSVCENYKNHIIPFNHAIGDISDIKRISPYLCDLLLKNADKLEIRNDFEFDNYFIFVNKQNFDKYILPQIENSI